MTIKNPIKKFSNQFINYLVVLFSLMAFTVPVMLPATSLAATCDTITSQVNNGVNAATSSSGSCGSTDLSSGIKSTAVVVVNILSIVVGVVAVIMIIYGGFRYISSGGESGSVSSAKNTLLFAIVGLVIVALAQIIVRWVIGTSTQIAAPAGFLHF